MTVAPVPSSPSQLRPHLGLAFAWGLAESTFFFLVPDVLTSRWVLQNPRRGFLACFASLGGALLGGAILYAIGSRSTLVGPMLVAMNCLPGISPALGETARLSLEQHGVGALFGGILSGIPYKLFALQAQEAGVNLGVFMAASAAARLFRFLCVTGFAWLIGQTLMAKLSATTRLRIHAAGWTLFYLVYFWRMSG